MTGHDATERDMISQGTREDEPTRHDNDTRQQHEMTRHHTKQQDMGRKSRTAFWHTESLRFTSGVIGIAVWAAPCLLPHLSPLCFTPLCTV